VSAGTRPAAPSDVRTLREEQADAGFPLYIHGGWRAQYPWLVQGVTGRASGASGDLSLFGDTPTGVVQARWAALRRSTGLACAAHARQVHGARVLCHEHATAGMLLADSADGHATAHAGILLAVTVADCVPVSIVEPERRVVALLHAGWRGVAAGVLEAGIRTLSRLSGRPPAAFALHLGPAICGGCYEVGPEVHAALGTGATDRAAPVDLRAVLAVRAAAAGLSPAMVSLSEYCTRCGTGRFYSHRGGDRERQAAFLGIRATPD
jgi:YfiH family protein